MIGYKMDSSLAEVYTTVKSSLVETFKRRWKYDMAINMATLFAKGVLWRSSVLDNLKPSDEKLDLKRTPTWGI